MFEFLAEELSTIWLIFGVGLPEEVSSFGTEESVEGIIWLSLGKRWVLGEHDKEDDTASK